MGCCYEFIKFNGDYRELATIGFNRGTDLLLFDYKFNAADPNELDDLSYD
jgi:hypothetical protein